VAQEEVGRTQYFVIGLLPWNRTSTTFYDELILSTDSELAIEARRELVAMFVVHSDEWNNFPLPCECNRGEHAQGADNDG
jgi:hypothetical protein